MTQIVLDDKPRIAPWLGQMPASSFGERTEVVFAFAALVLSDLALRLTGFHRFHALLRRCPTLGRNRTHQQTAARICRAVDRAAACYLESAGCLQRSATAICLLRLRGVPATMVIGVDKVPFDAHVWVEVGDLVVNDHPSVKQRYTELERC